jgi:hypothetical protein
MTVNTSINLMFDPSPDDGSTFAGAFGVLAKWYAAHAAIRRLWAIREPQRIRVIVTLEPTGDGDDISPTWLANGREWAQELQLGLPAPVQLDVIDGPFLAEFTAGFLLAEVSWRDASMLPDDHDGGALT